MERGHAEVVVSKISSALDLRDRYGTEIKFSPGYGLLKSYIPHWEGTE